MNINYKTIKFLVLFTITAQHGHIEAAWYNPLTWFTKAGDSLAIETAKVIQTTATDSMQKFDKITDKVLASAKPVAWASVGIAGVGVSYLITRDIVRGTAYLCSDTPESLELKQKRMAIAAAEKHQKLVNDARAALIASIEKNDFATIGAFGLPKSCQTQVLKLILLSGGKEEIEKMAELFKQFKSPK
jgi:hypothetical protein